jgi:hypothetical protein
LLRPEGLEDPKQDWERLASPVPSVTSPWLQPCRSSWHN